MERRAETYKHHINNRGRLSAAGGKLPKRLNLEDIERSGEDVRAGRDVAGNDFLKDFGFRSIEFGLWVNTEESRRPDQSGTRSHARRSLRRNGADPRCSGAPDPPVFRQGCGAGGRSLDQQRHRQGNRRPRRRPVRQQVRRQAGRCRGVEGGQRVAAAHAGQPFTKALGDELAQQFIAPVVRKQAEKQAAEWVIARVGKDVAISVPAEFANEYGQQVINEVAAGLSTGRTAEETLSDPKVQDKLLNAGLAGSAGGPLFGIFGGLAGRHKPQMPVIQPPPEDKAKPPAAAAATPPVVAGTPPATPPAGPGAQSAPDYMQVAGAIIGAAAAGEGQERRTSWPCARPRDFPER